MADALTKLAEAIRANGDGRLPFAAISWVVISLRDDITEDFLKEFAEYVSWPSVIYSFKKGNIDLSPEFIAEMKIRGFIDDNNCGP